MRKISAAVTAAVVFGGALIPELSEAVRFPIPVLFQITRNTVGNVEDPRIRSEVPERIVFTSTGNVMGPGTQTANREIYQWDYDTGVLERLTTTIGGESFAGSRPTDITQTSRPEYVAFVSTGNLDPSIGNADGNAEIFIRVRSGGAIRQVTDTVAPVENRDPYPSDSGRCIVFSSTGNINDNDGSQDPQNPTQNYANADGSEEVFLVQMDNNIFPEAGSYTQLTSGPVGTVSSRPVIGGFYYPRQCNTTAYMSDHVQVPGGNPGLQLYRYTRSLGANELFTAQEIPFPGMLPPAGIYLQPGMSSASNFARGPFVVFHTDTDVWNNASTNLNIFRYRSFHPRMTQYTDLEGTDVAQNAVVSDGGRWIAFESNANLIRVGIGDSVPPFNEDKNWEIFRMQKLRRVQQLTETQGCTSDQASMNDDGLNVTFRSTCDLIPGLNPNGFRQVYLYAQVKEDDPLAGTIACQVSQGCCNEANGCYRKVEGKTTKVSRKNCLAHPNGCDS